MGGGTELMSRKEVQRLTVLQRVLEEGLEQARAAQQLGLSVRQVKRLCRRLREEGAAGLISRRRGRPSNRRIGCYVYLASGLRTTGSVKGTGG